LHIAAASFFLFINAYSFFLVYFLPNSKPKGQHDSKPRPPWLQSQGHRDYKPKATQRQAQRKQCDVTASPSQCDGKAGSQNDLNKPGPLANGQWQMHDAYSPLSNVFDMPFSDV